MAWLSRMMARFRRKPPAEPSLTQCPKCGGEMTLLEKTTFTGNDMRTYRCEQCREEHIVNFGEALWKVLHDAQNPEPEQ